jgi:hypothetical protein
MTRDFDLSLCFIQWGCEHSSRTARGGLQSARRMLCMQVIVLNCRFYFGCDAVSGQKLGKSKEAWRPPPTPNVEAPKRLL